MSFEDKEQRGKKHPKGVHIGQYMSIIIFEHDTVIGTEGNFSKRPEKEELVVNSL
jgi:hypothetical protein